MKINFSPAPASRVRMRTDGPPMPIYRRRDHRPARDESFLAMSRRRLPWLLIATAGAVLFGGLVGHALAATAQDLDKDAGQALTTLYTRNPMAETASTLEDDAYAFITDPQGRMASVSIEGTRISHLMR